MFYNFLNNQNRISKRNRKRYNSKEIFFKTCSILLQTNFSYLTYFLFKRKQKNVFYTTIKNNCVFTGISRSIPSRLKISRFMLINKTNSGKLPGFYRAV